jgi:hypothetical protein
MFPILKQQKNISYFDYKYIQTNFRTINEDLNHAIIDNQFSNFIKFLLII